MGKGSHSGVYLHHWNIIEFCIVFLTPIVFHSPYLLAPHLFGLLLLMARSRSSLCGSLKYGLGTILANCSSFQGMHEFCLFHHDAEAIHYL